MMRIMTVSMSILIRARSFKISLACRKTRVYLWRGCSPLIHIRFAVCGINTAYWRLAQSVEHLTVNQGVTGSSPVFPAKVYRLIFLYDLNALFTHSCLYCPENYLENIRWLGVPVEYRHRKTPFLYAPVA